MSVFRRREDDGTYKPAAAGTSSPEPDDDFRAIDPNSGVKRGLKTRHISMMALAGIIGPGLLVGSGGALASGGPASLIIGFGVIGLLAFSVMQSLGEMTTLYPSGGAFTTLADRFVDKAFGVAVGWNYFIIWIAVLANEYNAISSIFVFWSDKVPVWGYFLIFWVSEVSCSVAAVTQAPLELTLTRRAVFISRLPTSRCRDIRRSRILACIAQACWTCGILFLLRHVGLMGNSSPRHPADHN
jgi:amino acid permease